MRTCVVAVGAWCGEAGGAPAEGGAEPAAAGDAPPQLPGEHAPPPPLPALRHTPGYTGTQQHRTNGHHIRYYTTYFLFVSN